MPPRPHQGHVELFLKMFKCTKTKKVPSLGVKLTNSESHGGMEYFLHQVCPRQRDLLQMVALYFCFLDLTWFCGTCQVYLQTFAYGKTLMQHAKVTKIEMGDYQAPL